MASGDNQIDTTVSKQVNGAVLVFRRMNDTLALKLWLARNGVE